MSAILITQSPYYLFLLLFVYIFIVWGLSNILAFMKISDGIRSIHPLVQEVLGCPACNAFWIGVVLYFIGIDFLPLLQPTNYVLLNDLILAFLHGCLASGISWTIYCLLHLTGQYD
jgi:hypothetical protein